MIFDSYQTLLISFWTTTLTYTLYSLPYTEIVHIVFSHYFLLSTIYMLLLYLLNVSVIDV